MMTKLPRRSLLAGLLAMGAAGCTGSGAMTSAGARRKAPADPWQGVRGEFNLSPAWIHMTGFLLASHPRPVREAIERLRSELDENPVDALHAHEDLAPVREAAAAYMGVGAEEIALTDSTTMGLASMYLGLPLEAGDEVLTTEHDHYSTHESLRLAAERTGAVVRKIALYARGSAATATEMAGAIEAALTPATRVVAITWVHSSSGVKTPVRAIAEVVARSNQGRAPRERVVCCVDGVHGFGVEDATMADLGCDFFAAGCHKWMFGPRGTGVLWGRRELWPTLRPSIPSFGKAAYEAWLRQQPPPPTTADMMSPGGFHSFEHRWALPAAFAFHRGIGKAKVAARIHALNRQCKEGLKGMGHVTLHTPLDDALSAGIVCFEVAGMTPEAVVARLRERKIIASTSPYATSYVRVAPSLLNSEADVEAVLRAIRALA
ncbi:aminotransferase class V-fold PLP-dependent enzyme [Sorangium atrum]|uniref:Aminotransferase class V-fold PLP-dependent enzyme n=1 Tax=Sorangium atrum TaxID=2995308 RepID=A0ABT5C320_9BACT|nr:aminotransferase class V-fold PLP-dependent enzyme [Sorangium aterium]MDC0680801.1 aminotransferase class V-fold PLP-dependent enzyme [Sorangium aterium]